MTDRNDEVERRVSFKLLEQGKSMKTVKCYIERKSLIYVRITGLTLGIFVSWKCEIVDKEITDMKEAMELLR